MLEKIIGGLFTVLFIDTWRQIKEPPAIAAAPVIKKTDWIKLYDKASQKTTDNFRKASVGKKGLYLIRENGGIVYIGHSKHDLYKVITRHFQEWRDTEQPNRLTYTNKRRKNTYEIQIFYIPQNLLREVELRLIRRETPRDNKTKYQKTSSVSFTKKGAEFAELIRPSRVIRQYKPVDADVPF